MLLNPEGDRGQDEKENKVLEKEVNHKLGRRARFEMVSLSEVLTPRTSECDCICSQGL